MSTDIEFYCVPGYGNMLQVSDRRVLWETNILSDFDEHDFYFDCELALIELSEQYNTEFVLAGRMSRHVCIEDTPDNRRNYQNIVESVKQKQDEIISNYK